MCLLVGAPGRALALSPAEVQVGYPSAGQGARAWWMGEGCSPPLARCLECWETMSVAAGSGDPGEPESPALPACREGERLRGQHSCWERLADVV